MQIAKGNSPQQKQTGSLQRVGLQLRPTQDLVPGNVCTWRKCVMSVNMTKPKTPKIKLILTKKKATKRNKECAM